MIEHETMASLGLGTISMAQRKGQYLKNDVRRFERCAYANHDMLKSIPALPKNRNRVKMLVDFEIASDMMCLCSAFFFSLLRALSLPPSLCLLHSC